MLTPIPKPVATCRPQPMDALDSRGRRPAEQGSGFIPSLHAGCYPSLAAALPAAAKERMGSGSVSRRCLLAHHPARLDKPSEEGSKERVTSPAHHHLLQPCCISSPEASIPKLTTMCRQANAQRLPSTPRKKTRASRVAGSSWRRSRSPCRWLQYPLWHHPKKAPVPG